MGYFIAKIRSQLVREQVLQFEHTVFAEGVKCFRSFKQRAQRPFWLYATRLKLGCRSTMGLDDVPYHRFELRRDKVPSNNHVAVEASDKRAHHAFRVAWRYPWAVLNQSCDVLSVWIVGIKNLHSGRIEHRLHGQASAHASDAEHAPTKALMLWVVLARLKPWCPSDDPASRVQHLARDETAEYRNACLLVDTLFELRHRRRIRHFAKGEDGFVERLVPDNGECTLNQLCGIDAGRDGLQFRH